MLLTQYKQIPPQSTFPEETFKFKRVDTLPEMYLRNVGNIVRQTLSEMNYISDPSKKYVQSEHRVVGEISQISYFGCNLGVKMEGPSYWKQKGIDINPEETEKFCRAYKEAAIKPCLIEISPNFNISPTRTPSKMELHPYSLGSKERVNAYTFIYSICKYYDYADIVYRLTCDMFGDKDKVAETMSRYKFKQFTQEISKEAPNTYEEQIILDCLHIASALVSCVTNKQDSLSVMDFPVLLISFRNPDSLNESFTKFFNNLVRYKLFNGQILYAK